MSRYRMYLHIEASEVGDEHALVLVREGGGGKDGIRQGRWRHRGEAKVARVWMERAERTDLPDTRYWQPSLPCRRSFLRCS